jgi:hypothetical protein
MISPERVELLKQTRTYYKCQNKTRLIQKRIDFIKNKLNPNQDGTHN